MVKINKIYTRTGDNGTTGLVRGPRRMKHDLRVEAYGTVDEANSFLGMARLHTGSMPKVDRLFARVQNDLFDLGADLSTPGADPEGTTSLRITAQVLTYLNRLSDLMFVMARVANANGVSDVLWTPGKFATAEPQRSISNSLEQRE